MYKFDREDLVEEFVGQLNIFASSRYTGTFCVVAKRCLPGTPKLTESEVKQKIKEFKKLDVVGMRREYRNMRRRANRAYMSWLRRNIHLLNPAHTGPVL
jgi:hypothetical protein